MMLSPELRGRASEPKPETLLFSAPRRFDAARTAFARAALEVGAAALPVLERVVLEFDEFIALEFIAPELIAFVDAPPVPPEIAPLAPTAVPELPPAPRFAVLPMFPPPERAPVAVPVVAPAVPVALVVVGSETSRASPDVKPLAVAGGNASELRAEGTEVPPESEVPLWASAPDASITTRLAAGIVVLVNVNISRRVDASRFPPKTLSSTKEIPLLRLIAVPVSVVP